MALTADQRIAQLESQLAERDAQLAELTVELEAALVRIAELEAKVNRNSKNSSMPPSSDKPWNKPTAKPKKKGKRKRGGQRGHKGHQRALLPLEQVRHVEELHPEQCNSCGSTQLIDDGSEPLRHQVTDLPPVEPFTDEWRSANEASRSC